MQDEGKYKKYLADFIQKSVLPGSYVLRLNSEYFQGIPDIIVLYNNRWAMLEAKRSVDAPHRPNQDYWVDIFDELSFAAFIYPENEEVVLRELQQALLL
jgi:hypothetical protein